MGFELTTSCVREVQRKTVKISVPLNEGRNNDVPAAVSDPTEMSKNSLRFQLFPQNFSQFSEWRLVPLPLLP